MKIIKFVVIIMLIGSLITQKDIIKTNFYDRTENLSIPSANLDIRDTEKITYCGVYLDITNNKYSFNTLNMYKTNTSVEMELLKNNTSLYTIYVINTELVQKDSIPDIVEENIVSYEDRENLKDKFVIYENTGHVYIEGKDRTLYLVRIQKHDDRIKIEDIVDQLEVDIDMSWKEIMGILKEKEEQWKEK